MIQIKGLGEIRKRNGEPALSVPYDDPARLFDLKLDGLRGSDPCGAICPDLPNVM
jgi:hypothetical protein